ncbi:MAG: YraN family protein [Solirubrobacterales bacterium]
MSLDPRTHVGRRGEQLAAEHLQRLGYELVERNYRTRDGEIDLIAASDAVLVFCEVKTLMVRRPAGRAAFRPLESVTQPKRARIRRIARGWIATHSAGGREQLRFDAIGVTLTPSGGLRELEHIEAAF